jgi:hypothetical protein
MLLVWQTNNVPSYQVLQFHPSFEKVTSTITVAQSFGFEGKTALGQLGRGMRFKLIGFIMFNTLGS